MSVSLANLLARTATLVPLLGAAVAGGAESEDLDTSSPSPLDALVEIGKGNEVKAREDLFVGIRVVGSGFESEGKGEALPAALWVMPRMPCYTWELVYYGHHYDVDPAKSVYEFEARAGTTLDLSWRGMGENGGWLPYSWTLDERPGSVCLKAGDAFRSECKTPQGAAIDDFLAQFVSKSGEVVLGSRELLYLLEMGPGHPGEASFDHRDLAVIVSLREATQPTAEAASLAIGETNQFDRKQSDVHGAVSGFDPNEYYEDVPPMLVTLSGLSPRSATYLRFYSGGPAEEVPQSNVRIVRESYVWNDDATPQDRQFVLKNLDHYFVREGMHTIELVHEASGGSTVLFRSQILVDRTFLPRPFYLGTED